MNRFKRAVFAFFVAVMVMVLVLAPVGVILESVNAPDWLAALLFFPLMIIWWHWSQSYIRKPGDPDDV